MAYTKQVWQYESTGGTPLSADRFNTMEQGIADAALTADTAAATANAALPKVSIQSGSVSITPSAINTPTSATVTFPTPFAAPPNVVVTANTGAPGTSVTGVSAATVTTTGAVLWLTRSNTTTTTVWWVAVAP